MGRYGVANAGQDGFVDAVNSFTPVVDPSVTGSPLVTNAYGINNAGQVVGEYNNSSGSHAFLETPSGGFSTIDLSSVASGTFGSSAGGINDPGQIVGDYGDATGRNGFLDVNGAITKIDDPLGTLGALNDTDANGINNAGQIVGYYADSSGGTHGFVDTNGIFTTIDDPSAASGSTDVWGINDSGQIVGQYTDSNGVTHAFLATPVPEPASMEELGSGLLGLALIRRRGRDARAAPIRRAAFGSAGPCRLSEAVRLDADWPAPSAHDPGDAECQTYDMGAARCNECSCACDGDRAAILPPASGKPLKLAQASPSDRWS